MYFLVQFSSPFCKYLALNRSMLVHMTLIVETEENIFLSTVQACSEVHVYGQL